MPYILNRHYVVRLNKILFVGTHTECNEWLTDNWQRHLKANEGVFNGLHIAATAIPLIMSDGSPLTTEAERKSLFGGYANN